LQRTVLVVVDGTVALAGGVVTNPAESKSLFVGANFAGGSTTRQAFSGEIRAIDRADWREVLKSLPSDRLTPEEATERLALASPAPEWMGYSGPLRIRVRLPAGSAGQAEPIVASGITGKGDFVYVRHLGDGRVTFGFDHWGVGGPESAPVVVNASREVELVVSHGGLMPPASAELYRRAPALAELREAVLIAVDDRIVLSASMAAHPSAPGNIVIGSNLIGGSTTTEQFAGDFLAVSSESADAVRRLRGAGAAGR
jgi:hypothetical protein